jgi:hypothetical protein
MKAETQYSMPFGSWIPARAHLAKTKLEELSPSANPPDETVMIPGRNTLRGATDNPHKNRLLKCSQKGEKP